MVSQCSFPSPVTLVWKVIRPSMNRMKLKCVVLSYYGKILWNKSNKLLYFLLFFYDILYVNKLSFLSYGLYQTFHNKVYTILIQSFLLQSFTIVIRLFTLNSIQRHLVFQAALALLLRFRLWCSLLISRN